MKNTFFFFLKVTFYDAQQGHMTSHVSMSQIQPGHLSLSHPVVDGGETEWGDLIEQQMYQKNLLYTFPTTLKGNSGIFKPRPYFWHEIRSSTHREQFGESRRPSEDI